ncbi:MAG: glutathione S-transferase family protein [Pseudomonadales bacterium]|nr:glutathione S-transferase family protein [Pseudomonadales bacterium]
MLKVYDHPLSPYAQKVKISLIEKEIPFEALLPTAIGSGQTDDEFARVNPRQEVPTLVDGDVAVFDSTIILEYLEDKYPSPPMLPATPAERARVRMIEEVMDTHYEPINWGLAEVAYFGRGGDKLAGALNDAAAEQVSAFHRWLEAELGDRTWFNGETFGWGDLSVIAYINGSAGFGLVPPTGSKLAAWSERANARPSVAQVTAAAAQMSMGGNAAGMDAVKAALDQGLFKREYRDHRLEWMIKSGGLAVVVDGLERQNIRFTPPFDSR